MFYKESVIMTSIVPLISNVKIRPNGEDIAAVVIDSDSFTKLNQKKFLF